MRLINRNHKHYDKVRRMGVICYHCGVQLCEIADGPGHVMSCDECADKIDYKYHNRQKDRSNLIYLDE